MPYGSGFCDVATVEAEKTHCFGKWQKAHFLHLPHTHTHRSNAEAARKAIYLNQVQQFTFQLLYAYLIYEIAIMNTIRQCHLLAGLFLTWALRSWCANAPVHDASLKCIRCVRSLLLQINAAILPNEASQQASVSMCTSTENRLFIILVHRTSYNNPCHPLSYCAE